MQAESTVSMEDGELSITEIEDIIMTSMKAGVPQDVTQRISSIPRPKHFQLVYHSLVSRSWASRHYTIQPDNVARGKFLANLISENLDWIGLDRKKAVPKSSTMALAFVPYVSQVLAIDHSRGMVNKYNSISAATNHKHPGCDTRAIYGDLIDRYNLRPAVDSRITDPDGEYLSFDLVVMCQAIDSFVSDFDAASAVQSMELVNALDILAGRLKDNGVLVIVDIEMFYGDANLADEALLDGRKESGSGSREVVAALKEIEMEDIAVTENRDFKIEFELFQNKQKTHYKYFMARAKIVKEGDD